MSNNPKSQRRRRWVRTAVLIVICGALVVAIKERSSVHTTRRRAQNAADGAALSGVRCLALATYLEAPPDGEEIEAEMWEFAVRNGVTEEDTIVGYYLDAGCNRLGPVGWDVPPATKGVEARVTMRADSFLTRLLGLPGWPVEQRNAVIIRVTDAGVQGIPTQPYVSCE
jgi:hypothetical protein